MMRFFDEKRYLTIVKQHHMALVAGNGKFGHTIEKPVEERDMKSLLIKDTTREEREEIVRRALWGGCGAECEFCSGCDNRGGGRIDSMYQPYIDGEKEIAEINAEYRAPFVR